MFPPSIDEDHDNPKSILLYPPISAEERESPQSGILSSPSIPEEAQSNTLSPSEPCDNSTKPEFDTKNQLLQLVLKLMQNCTDEDVLLVRTWIADYKSLRPEQKMYVRKAIQQILFEALYGALKRGSIVINSPPVCTALSTDASAHLPIYYGNIDDDNNGTAHMACTLVCQNKIQFNIN